MSRLGIRFVDRLVGDKMNNIEEYVRKDFLPPLMKKGETPSSFSQAMYKTKEGFSWGCTGGGLGLIKISPIWTLFKR